MARLITRILISYILIALLQAIHRRFGVLGVLAIGVLFVIVARFLPTLLKLGATAL